MIATTYVKLHGKYINSTTDSTSTEDGSIHWIPIITVLVVDTPTCASNNLPPVDFRNLKAMAMPYIPEPAFLEPPPPPWWVQRPHRARFRPVRAVGRPHHRQPRVYRLPGPCEPRKVSRPRPMAWKTLRKRWK